jgi:hypothetical protein
MRDLKMPTTMALRLFLEGRLTPEEYLAMRTSEPQDTVLVFEPDEEFLKEHGIVKGDKHGNA